LTNKCFTSCGLRYKTRGRRMSGDMNTAVGNCLLMLLMLSAFAKTVGLKKWDCLDDGDDALLLVEQRDLDLVQATISDVFRSFGMTLKIETVAKTLYEIEFCQSRVIEYLPGKYKFIRDYRNVLSKALCGVRNWQDITYRKRTLTAIGTCELVLGLGVPVLQAYAQAVLRNCPGSAHALAYAPDGLRVRAQRDAKYIGVPVAHIRPTVVADCARVSFENAFGLSMQEQVRLEQRFDSWEFDPALEAIPVWEVDVFKWSSAPSLEELHQF